MIIASVFGEISQKIDPKCSNDLGFFAITATMGTPPFQYSVLILLNLCFIYLLMFNCKEWQRKDVARKPRVSFLFWKVWCKDEGLRWMWTLCWGG